MKKITRTLAGLALSLGMIVTFMPASTTTAWADDDPAVSYQSPVYVDEDDVTKGISGWDSETCTDYEVMTDSTATLGETGKTSWYLVEGQCTTTDLKVCGSVNIILAEGCLLTANATSESGNAGIEVSGDENSLTIWGQSANTGELKATGDKGEYLRGAAGIGGSKMQAGGRITINGGIITAAGQYYSAGIGGGSYGGGSDITINGGTVAASGGSRGAGIGGGSSSTGSDITINGGTVTASGRYGGAGIGGGSSGPGSHITVNGGSILANGGAGGAGIGGGFSNLASDININGGSILANGGEAYDMTGVYGEYGDGMGSGYNGSSSTGIKASADAVKILAGSGESDLTALANDGNDLAEALSGKSCVKILPETTVQQVIDMIEALADPSDITADSYDQVQAAADAYMDLASDKKARVPEETSDRLLEVQKALAAALKEASVKDISHYVNTISESLAYTGQPLTPEVTIEGLTQDDYTIQCTDNIEIGRATAIITGTGKYKGSITRTFDIVPAEAAIASAKAGKKKITVKAAAQEGQVAYQFYIKRSGKSARNYRTTSTAKTIKKLTSRKTYTVKVRAFKVVGGETYYGAWSPARKVKVK